ncbi:hypothetical protein [Bombilactobacillus thymidiniphilus]|uniref:Uncharacterized protein n=1 Tax=Bombilactobacillus thymidiniphilus TaxID=2923363 RepID=A0ABY4PEN9_9LACO|nr:hypothetical protein [Bombilactobacillus thymidiniphilus]UQS84259.1 hypothetical protein MOO47_03670 [Bombilactobacillus thymidiniphilus]
MSDIIKDFKKKAQQEAIKGLGLAAVSGLKLKNAANNTAISLKMETAKDVEKTAVSSLSDYLKGEGSDRAKRSIQKDIDAIK